MEDEERRAVLDHVAGATVRHRSPFAELEVPALREPPPRDLIKRWIKPFYMGRLDSAWAGALRAQLHEVDEALVRRLLSYFDWRPRIVASYFATIKSCTSLEEQLGRLLLRSDVCYAGRGFALALASFNTSTSLAYMTRYLDYYLERQELWFDQGEVMAGVARLDRINGTHRLDDYSERWARFTANKPNWKLERTMEQFDRDLDVLRSLAHGR